MAGSKGYATYEMILVTTKDVWCSPGSVLYHYSFLALLRGCKLNMCLQLL